MTSTDSSTSNPQDSKAPGEITKVLQAWSEGDASALDRLYSMVLDELRIIARSALAREDPHHSLQATELLNEVYLKLRNQKTSHWENRSQFYAFSSKLIRFILVDHARRRLAAKRSAIRIPFDEVLGIPDERIPSILAFDEALMDLETLDPLQAEVAEMRLWGGWTIAEIAEAQGVSPTTVKRRWASAQLWLRRYFSRQSNEWTDPS